MSSWPDGRTKFSSLAATFVVDNVLLFPQAEHRRKTTMIMMMQLAAAAALEFVTGQ